MRTTWAGLVFLCVCVSLFSGCANQELIYQNQMQAQQIAALENDLNAKNMELDQRARQIAEAADKHKIEMDSLNSKVVALELDLENKKSIISALQKSLLTTGGQLPVELTSKLEELADKYSMISYDDERGVLKFESDLTFEKGSDQVMSSASDAVKQLCSIMNSPEAEKFDIVVAGHTDDIPVLKPETKAKHPTNWHLSAHRSISVLNIMTANSITAKRLSVRGFGEFRPVEDNLPNMKGNPKNRRVEIYIIPQGM